MKTIIFEVKKIADTSLIDYPDDRSLFNTTDRKTVPGYIIAGYSGVMDLTEYTYPPEPVTWTLYEFRSKFTIAEKVAIETSVDPIVTVIQKDMDAATQIDSDNTDLIYGMNYLVTAGILTQERRDEIMEVTASD